MCQKCVDEAEKVPGFGNRVIALRDFSTQLVDAFIEAADAGVVQVPVLIVDGSDDVASLHKVEYDKDRKCVIVRIGYPDYDIDNSNVKRAMDEVRNA